MKHKRFRVWTYCTWRQWLVGVTFYQSEVVLHLAFFRIAIVWDIED